MYEVGHAVLSDWSQPQQTGLLHSTLSGDEIRSDDVRSGEMN